MRTPKALLAILVTLGMALTIGCSGANDIVSAKGDPGAGGVIGEAPPPPESSPELDDRGGDVDLQ